ncbi:MAG: hypothetical protein RMI01_09565, partial [Thermodesulfovibrio sp.]|nr:hypothetical protein [Thermodesulfovibrio sp.]
MEVILVLQDIIRKTKISEEIEQRINYDISYFSPTKKLFDYQKNAIKDIFKTLILYYNVCRQEKNNLFEYYKAHGLKEKYITVKNPNPYLDFGFSINQFNQISIDQLINRA